MPQVVARATGFLSLSAGRDSQCNPSYSAVVTPTTYLSGGGFEIKAYLWFYDHIKVFFHQKRGLPRSLAIDPCLLSSKPVLDSLANFNCNKTKTLSFIQRVHSQQVPLVLIVQCSTEL